MSSEKLTVAELLARNARTARGDDSGETARPRRRRSLEDGGVSVAELTGDIPVVRDGATRDSATGPSTGTAGAAGSARPTGTTGAAGSTGTPGGDARTQGRPAARPASRGEATPSSATTNITATVPDSALLGGGSGATHRGSQSRGVVSDAAATGGTTASPATGTGQRRDRDARDGGARDTRTTTESDDRGAAAGGSGAWSRWRDSRDTGRPATTASAASTVATAGAGATAATATTAASTPDTDRTTADRAADTDRDRRGDRDARATTTVHPVHDPAPGDPTEEDLAEDEIIEYEDDSISWPMMILQAIIAIAVGVGVFFGFTLLWNSLSSVIVLVLALAVTLVLVGLVHALLRHRDTLLMILAFIVGLVLTVGPRLLLSV
ncbi:hypothetical protein [Corynebacterium bovis]|uniref:Putative membrane protein n=1 Tax=Corynebacterium bovis DSM 20582 = CIP 54.80 TaxID=927655 RepID=A0A8H9YC96_9CORY|nr:hypothetical protein [Corynebacterium bovis]MBB3116602.1 putative membrane protein [Corynebacterium bovis DSM 20582 = CIP 54.80]QQC47161.1 hypothetical protein I6I09_08955 [Corynebacterium bovis]WJY76844.1 hypothetical protein CBOVI_01500 [Corynebacterium bovis DSM 20582 = CIP 54.80]